MFKLNKYQKLGFVCIILSIILFFSNSVDLVIRPFLHLILMGSSKGKDILFFAIFGIFLIFSEMENWNIIKKIPWPNFLKKDHDFYLKLGFLLLLSLALWGLITEVIIRYNFGIGVFTIFTSMDPSMTSTSLLHSHVYKSVLGTLINAVLVSIPQGIHIGNSLSQYVPWYTKYLFVLIPVLFLIMLKILQNKTKFTRLFLSMTMTLGLIGVMDGGFFSTPCVGGLYGFLVVYYDYSSFTYWIGRIFGIKKWVENEKDNINIPKKWNDYKKIFKVLLPHLILIFIILLRFSVAFIGSNPEYYDVTIMNPSDNCDLSQYNTLNITETDNSIHAQFNSNYNEMELENSLARSLQGKCDWFSESWNIYSYL